MIRISNGSVNRTWRELSTLWFAPVVRMSSFDVAWNIATASSKGHTVQESKVITSRQSVVSQNQSLRSLTLISREIAIASSSLFCKQPQGSTSVFADPTGEQEVHHCAE